MQNIDGEITYLGKNIFITDTIPDDVDDITKNKYIEFNKLSPTSKMYTWYLTICKELKVSPISIHEFYDVYISWHNDKCFNMAKTFNTKVRISPSGLVRFDDTINMWVSYIEDAIVIKFDMLSIEEINELLTENEINPLGQYYE